MESRPPRCGLMPFLFALIVCGLVPTIVSGGSGVAAVSQFQWSGSASNLPQSDGFQLTGSVTVTYNNVYMVYQCSFRCLQMSAVQCASYNFIPAQRKCELNSASHVTSPNSLLPINGSQYFLRTTYSIEQPQLALGPCANSPCANQGICMTQMAQDGSLSAKCLCTNGWTGAACDVQVSRPIWNAWSAWTQCSSSCGNGMTSRTRTCTLNGQAVDNQLCYGPVVEQESCYLKDCPGWTSYGPWSQCSADTSCGTGTETRTHSCSNGGVPGVDPMCMGPVSQSTPCTSPSCTAPVRLVGGTTFGEGRVNIFNDVTGAWLPVCASSWTKADADVVCKQLGFKKGSVQVQAGTYGNEPGASTAVNGTKCAGNENFLATCLRSTWNNANCSTGPHAGVQCIVDGQWNSWSLWSTCSVSCGHGVLTRQRQCNSPAPARGGQSCDGSAVDTTPCTAGLCPVDGVWNDWGQWDNCNATCGSAIKQRQRTCDGPFNGGAACQGDETQITNCNLSPCPVDGQWSAWSAWAQCSVSCGGGTQNRYRLCNGASDGGSCGGSNTQQDQNQTCSTQSCPVDCTWLDWTDWSACSATCGGGTQTRTRSTNPAQFGGLECVGDTTQSMQCNPNPCSIPGLWLAWSGWSKCSATCGTSGLKLRTRVCNMTSYGSLTSNCPLTNGIGSTDSMACNQFSCSPIAASCSDLYQRGLEDSGVFVTIDPDSTESLQPFGVECQRSANGTIATLVHNEYELNTTVKGFAAPGTYSKTVTYVDNHGASISIAQISALVDLATTCRQYAKWQCFSSAINSPITATGNSYRITWLNNRNSNRMIYWAGANAPATTVSSETTICACGQTNSCAQPNTKCNCDAGDNVWRIDDGFVTRKLDLPISAINAGDTGPLPNQQGTYSIGPLICN